MKAKSINELLDQCLAIQFKGNPFTNENFELCSEDAVKQWVSEHTWNEIERVIRFGQSYLINGEAEAERWHEQFEVSKLYLKVMPILEEALNKHLYEMTVAETSDPVIFMPSVCNDRYTSKYGNLNVCYTVFIRTEDGRVLKTNVFDETYFGNEDSEATDKAAYNPLVFE